MPEPAINRRRALVLFASASAAVAACRWPDAADYEWTGTALGADARLLFAGSSRSAAERAVEECLTEISRLERIFSLFIPDSEIVRLNTFAVLDQPSIELKALLIESKRINHLTEQLFDPTVQPLWRHLASNSACAGEPLRCPGVAERLACVGMDKVDVGQRQIRLAPGTEVTLNGIAQGFITDRITALLIGRGWTHTLVDLGELRAIGGKANGRPFDIAVREGELAVRLENAALATSCAGSLLLSEHSRIGHVLHPRLAVAPSLSAAITVRHPSATVADALSTALLLASEPMRNRIAGRFPHARIWATNQTGKTRVSDNV